MGKFDKNTGAPISKANADKKAKKWKDNKNKKVETNACFIGRDWLEELLSKPGCTGIWVNFGESEDGKSVEPFFIAGDVDGNYIMSTETKTSTSEVAISNDIINDSTECPPDCPQPL
ncbi:MAG: hypothetical protein OEW67_13275 [Cyclobacteriaceae bacterium]|nr:hypothetical protein [Cyclobacteriaceae bacterium]